MFCLCIEKLFNLSEVLWRKHGNPNQKNGWYGDSDSVESNIFYGDFMVTLVRKFSWRNHIKPNWQNG